jgi:hypothetical protein
MTQSSRWIKINLQPCYYYAAVRRAVEETDIEWIIKNEDSIPLLDKIDE